jgi:vesicle coat complex subunit
MAEQAFIEELDQLVNHLAGRLSGDDNGQPRILRDSAVTNMSEFFARFRQLNISSNEQLDQLVGRCEELMNGVQPQSLRDNQSLRRSLSTNLSTVQSSLDQLLVDRPRRNIIRPFRQSREAE